MRLTRIAALTVVALAAMTAVSNADSVAVGSSNSGGNNFPFGTNAYNGLEYQQIYSAAAFASTFQINSIGFVPIGSGTGTYSLTLSLGVTSSTPAIPGTFAANSPQLSTVFSGNVVEAVAPSTPLTFALNIPYKFAPAMGNLVLDVQMATETVSGAIGGFAIGSSTQTGRIYQYPGNTTSQSDDGLYTIFNGSYVTTTPEPTSAIAVSLAALPLAFRRQRRPHAN